jgi:hypothetical protein
MYIGNIYIEVIGEEFLSGMGGVVVAGIHNMTLSGSCKDPVIHGNADILQLSPKGFDIYRNRVRMRGSTP